MSRIITLLHKYTVQDSCFIFERFYRVESSRNRANGGSELGLAICYNIVEAHGGKIIAQASSLGGVKISIEFPLDDNHKSQNV